MGPGNTAHWNDLSLDLWTNVLSRLEENFDPRFVWNQRDCLEQFAQEHSIMHKLRLVCSKFNMALDDDQLSRCLFLQENFSTKKLPNLLRWAERQHTFVQLFACNVGASALEAALAALASTKSQLRFTYIPKVFQAAVDILPCFSALHSIDLSSGGLSLSLQPLAALPSCFFPKAEALVPAGMSALKQLTLLDVTLCGNGLEDTSYSWLGSLTALQDLGFHAQEDVELPAELTALTGMTNLWLSTTDSDDSMACMKSQVNWRDMRALEYLSISSGLYAFDSRLLQILECPALEQLYFDKVRPDSADSAKFYAALAHNLAEKRPDVACYLDQVLISDVLELTLQG